MEGPTIKNTLPSKTLLQIWWRNQNFPDQQKLREFSTTKPAFREGNGTPLQYSCLENPMNGGTWWAAVHGVAKSRTWLSDFPFTFHFHALEKEMATHSSVLAWRIPGTGEPGGLLSMGLHRVGHDWSDSAAAAAAAAMHIYGSRNNGTDEPICRAGIETQT